MKEKILLSVHVTHREKCGKYNFFFDKIRKSYFVKIKTLKSNIKTIKIGECVFVLEVCCVEIYYKAFFDYFVFILATHAYEHRKSLAKCLIFFLYSLPKSYQTSLFAAFIGGTLSLNIRWRH